jgi:hypothetical protein
MALGFMPIGRMGPPLRSFAADAHDCIMVQVLRPSGYKVVARFEPRPKAGSPLIVIPTAPSGAIVLAAVKVRPGKGGACREVGQPRPLFGAPASAKSDRDEETSSDRTRN